MSSHDLPRGRMTRLLLITLLVLSHGPAYAEWVAVEKKEKLLGPHTVYIDPDTIREKGIW